MSRILKVRQGLPCQILVALPPKPLGEKLINRLPALLNDTVIEDSFNAKLANGASFTHNQGHNGTQICLLQLKGSVPKA